MERNTYFIVMMLPIKRSGTSSEYINAFLYLVGLGKDFWQEKAENYVNAEKTNVFNPSRSPKIKNKKCGCQIRCDP